MEPITSRTKHVLVIGTLYGCEGRINMCCQSRTWIQKIQTSQVQKWTGAWGVVKDQKNKGIPIQWLNRCTLIRHFMRTTTMEGFGDEKTGLIFYTWQLSLCSCMYYPWCVFILYILGPKASLLPVSILPRFICLSMFDMNWSELISRKWNHEKWC